MGKFQSRHYDALAKFVHDEFDSNSRICEKLADFFEEDNPKFWREMWMDACQKGHWRSLRQRPKDDYGHTIR